MPNHITTLCTVTGPDADVEAFKARHIVQHFEKDDGVHKAFDTFDFETVTPMPASVRATSRDFTKGDNAGDLEVEQYAIALLGGRDEAHHYPYPHHLPADCDTNESLMDHLRTKAPSVEKWARASLLAASDTGYPGWYEWSCANWGTKCNSYKYELRSFEPGRLVFRFDSAWAPPRPVLRKLGELWPTLCIETISVDEGGWPNKFGRYHHGEIEEIEAPQSDSVFTLVMGRPPEKGEEDEEESAPSAVAP
jgi:hypothetical protein